MWREKITAYVDFPLDLNMNTYSCGPDSRQPYSLYGVSVSLLQRFSRFSVFLGKSIDGKPCLICVTLLTYDPASLIPID